MSVLDLLFSVKVSLSQLLFSFDGRISRLQRWSYCIPHLVGYLCCNAANVDLGVAYTVITLFPTLAVHVYRCHDRGWSGWFVLLSLRPGGNLWYLIERGFLPGTRGLNKYGSDPDGWP